MHAHMHMCRDTHPCTCRSLWGKSSREKYSLIALYLIFILWEWVFLMNLELTFLFQAGGQQQALWSSFSNTPRAGVTDVHNCGVPVMCTTQCLAVVYVGAGDPNSGPYAFTLMLLPNTSDLPLWQLPFSKIWDSILCTLTFLHSHVHEFIPSALSL